MPLRMITLGLTESQKSGEHTTGTDTTESQVHRVAIMSHQ